MLISYINHDNILDKEWWLIRVQKTFYITVSVLWDLILALIFDIVGRLWFDIMGVTLFAHASLGFFYTFTLGRRWVNSQHKIFSYATLPMFIPCYFIFFNTTHEIFWGFNDLIISLVVLLISRTPLYFKQSTEMSFLAKQKNRVFLISIQMLYGFLIQICIPNFLEPLEWVLTPEWKPGLQYESVSPQIELYCENIISSQKINTIIPDVIEKLQTSPFFHHNIHFKLCQKKKFIHPFQEIKEYHEYVGGHYEPRKNYTYVYGNFDDSVDLNLYKTVIVHEFTHQMVHEYYGRWKGIIMRFIPIWKDEGYAEYVANQNQFLSKKELLDLIQTNEDVASRLSDPFTISMQENDIRYEDYQAALIQVRYALDYKKANVKDFFSNSYLLATKEEIIEWLHLPEMID
ncbi:MAG: hypothetical protein FJ161_03030 [Gammaproteobacteria bacterium]|nr:hypothetical protein [Gammaproteobacteria bacterium]